MATRHFSNAGQFYMQPDQRMITPPLSATSNQPETNDAQLLKPARHRMRFSLRTLLVLMTLICLGLGAFISEGAREHEAVEILCEDGAQIEYRRGTGWSGALGRKLRGKVHRCYFDDVVSVDLSDNWWDIQHHLSETTDLLSSFRSLHFAFFSQTDHSVRSIESLSSKASVTSLVLKNTIVTEQGWQLLSRVKTVEGLYLGGRYSVETFLCSPPEIDSREFRPFLRFSQAGMNRLSSLPLLKVLDLDESTLEKGALQEIGNISSLNVLSLNGALFDGDELKSLGKIPRLLVLELDGTAVSDDDLLRLDGITSLETLSLNETENTGSCFSAIVSLPRLWQLNLSNTIVDDSALAHLGRVSSLAQLDLWGTNVTDAGLRHLEGLTKLQELGLNETQVTPEGVARLQQRLPNCLIRH